MKYSITDYTCIINFWINNQLQQFLSNNSRISIKADSWYEYFAAFSFDNFQRTSPKGEKPMRSQDFLIVLSIDLIVTFFMNLFYCFYSEMTFPFMWPLPKNTQGKTMTHWNTKTPMFIDSLDSAHLPWILGNKGCPKKVS